MIESQNKKLNLAAKVEFLCFQINMSEETEPSKLSAAVNYVSGFVKENVGSLLGAEGMKSEGTITTSGDLKAVKEKGNVCGTAGKIEDTVAGKKEVDFEQKLTAPAGSQKHVIP